MRKTFGAVLGLLAAAHSFAVEAPAPTGVLKTLVQGIPHAALFGLDLDGDKGVAVGAGGEILESADGGQTWKRIEKSPTDLALLAVSKRGAHTIAVGQSGTVAYLDGSEWKRGDSGVPARLLSVDVNSSGLAVASGQFGTLIKSNDGGHTWSSTAPDFSLTADPDTFGTGEPTIYSVAVSEAGQITIAGEYGLVMRSDDGGANWRVIRKVDAKAPTLHALSIVEAGKGNSYAVGQQGTLLISVDGGETWSTCTMATKLNFLGVAASQTGQVVVTGMRVMYRSENNGMSWTQVTEGDAGTEWYQAARTAETSGRILAVGNSGKIIQVGS